jgi:hypothetical protein
MQQKQFMWLLDLASLLEAVGVDGALAGDAEGRRPPLLAPLVMWGYVLRSVRSYYTTPLNSSLGAPSPHETVGEGGGPVPAWIGRRERELCSFTVCSYCSVIRLPLPCKVLS